MEIVFMEGCFDNFDGSQEELDDLIKTIKEKFESMTPEELMEDSQSVEDAILEDDISDEELAEIMEAMGRNRNLQ